MNTETELLDQWRRGDKKAGDQLVRVHFEAVRRFFRSKAGDAASDLIQQTFLRCLEGKGFEGRSSFRTYILGIARFVLYEFYRSKKRGEQVDFGVSSVKMLGPSPSQLLAADDERRLVLEALQDIPLDQQVTLELHYWESLSLDDISEVLEVPVGTVKSRLFHGRRALKTRLGERFGGLGEMPAI